MNTAVPCQIEDFYERFDRYALAAQKRTGALPEQFPVLALHGARSNLHRLSPLLAPLQTLGVGSIAPSLSGHGSDSPVPVEHTSLAQNLQEALRFAELAGNSLRMVVGSSLGGALAMRVAEACRDRVDCLVLIGPALYPEAAWEAAHFGEPFRHAISVPFGFMESRSLDFLRSFNGRVMLVQGEWDGLPAAAHGGAAGRSAGETSITLPDGSRRTVWSPIPREVFDALREAAGDKLQHVVLQDCDHRAGQFLQLHPPVASALAQLVQQMLELPADSGTLPHVTITPTGLLLPKP